ncbi:MAG: hypothetical protein JEZ09_06820, partial [Salinivirgaceae bacterium]|nr:hypothetical protein [Salinivirgaceae bacterium]
MLLRVFKSNHPYVIFLIPLLGVLFWAPSLFNVHYNIPQATVINYSYLYKLLFGFLENNKTLSVFIGLVFMIIQSYILIRLNFKFIFIESKTYLPSIIFIIYSSLIIYYQQVHPLLVANFFILLAIDRVFIFDKEKNKFKRYFEGGFLIALGVLFYPNLFYFIILLWLTQILLRTFNWRELTSSIIGIVTPIIIYFAILFLLDSSSIILSDIKLIYLKTPSLPKFSIYSLCAFGVLAFILFISIISSARLVGLKKVSSRKYFSLFFWFLALCLVLFYFHPSFSYELILIAAIPISIIQTL